MDVTTDLLTYQTLNWLAFASAAACSALRYYIQKQKFGHLLLEDYIHIFAVTQLTALTIDASLYKALYYLPDDVSEEFYDVSWNVAVTSFVFYFTTLFTVKAMFLALYWRVFNVNRTYRTLWWFSAAFTACAFLAAFISIFWYCDNNPRAFGKWESSTCTGTTHASAAGGTIAWLVFNTSSDLIVFSIPLAMLHKLQMPRSKKYRLAPAFLLGLITIVLDVLTWTLNLAEGEGANETTIHDLGVFFQFLEPSIAVIVACLPVLLFAGSKSQDREGKTGVS